MSAGTMFVENNLRRDKILFNQMFLGYVERPTQLCLRRTVLSCYRFRTKTNQTVRAPIIQPIIEVVTKGLGILPHTGRDATHVSTRSRQVHHVEPRRGSKNRNQELDGLEHTGNVN